ncbi:hypothetical protein [Klebsiella spallanzanii]|uniref:hypothetical protein n=1 Tax=Klebsiella spallanzanii TaxID=2587528 RepID=UPI002597F787|nr:hypothetical protein [Klebsiella spallanzanii]MDM4208085.1 hypothetical protein [Klebsiella spallanzanii]
MSLIFGADRLISPKVVILVVLTEREFRLSLFISQLLATAIPVRGAKFLLLCVPANPYTF